MVKAAFNRFPRFCQLGRDASRVWCVVWCFVQPQTLPRFSEEAYSAQKCVALCARRECVERVRKNKGHWQFLYILKVLLPAWTGCARFQGFDWKLGCERQFCTLGLATLCVWRLRRLERDGLAPLILIVLHLSGGCVPHEYSSRC